MDVQSDIEKVADRDPIMEMGVMPNSAGTAFGFIAS
jgi:hypothetical protein